MSFHNLDYLIGGADPILKGPITDFFNMNTKILVFNKQLPAMLVFLGIFILLFLIIHIVMSFFNHIYSATIGGGENYQLLNKIYDFNDINKKNYDPVSFTPYVTPGEQRSISQNESISEGLMD